MSHQFVCGSCGHSTENQDFHFSHLEICPIRRGQIQNPVRKAKFLPPPEPEPIDLLYNALHEINEIITVALKKYREAKKKQEESK